MKSIVIPSAIKIPDVESLFTFYSFINGNVLSDSRFGKNLRTVKMARTIHLALMSTTKGAFLVSDEAHAIMLDIVENPKNGYDVNRALCLMPFFDAITEAPLYESEGVCGVPVSESAPVAQA